uniref:Transposase n=1 Tax=Siphoviridae sp. ct1Eo1 TaxID=2825307 RepID=A0A8S5P6N2_9CAUD|nr:MAG TPA: transposase [Siphoviridae sp. ct1Eo1]
MAILPDHSFNAFSAGRSGRPRKVELTDEQKKELAALYLATNATRKSGSMTLAWSIFASQQPELGWDAAAKSSKHTIPAVAREVMEHARPMVGFHRGGERKLRESAYSPGLLRRNLDGGLLRAGQRASWDDATINFGVCVPWPWRGSGDKCAEKYGVRLGRFQLLACHDDATSFIPAYSYVIRYEQTYRGEDVAGAMIRTCRDVGIFDAFVLEGGVWKSDRVQRLLDGLGIHHIDAKGRPQCKLVENFFNRLWSVLSVVPGQVGRYQAENKSTSEKYVACRNGRQDPRTLFPMLTDALAAIDWAINYLNTHPIESREYGKWIPRERWEADLKAQPMRQVDADFSWLQAPAIVKRKVVRGMLRATVPGPLGVPQRWSFSAPWLWTEEGKELMLHFDPLGEWPLSAIVTAPGSVKVLGEVSCTNPVSMGGCGEDISLQIRQIVRTEYRLLTATGKTGRESTLRALNGQTSIAQGVKGQDGDASADAPPDAVQVPAKVRASKLADPLSRAAAEDSRSTVPQPITPATRDDFAAMRRRARQANTATTLNF